MEASATDRQYPERRCPNMDPGVAPRAGSAAKVLEVSALGRPSLSLILGAEALRAVRPVGGGRPPEEAALSDLHARIDGDGQVGDVRELQGEVTVPAGVHEAGCGVN